MLQLRFVEGRGSRAVPDSRITRRGSWVSREAFLSRVLGCDARLGSAGPAIFARASREMCEGSKIVASTIQRRPGVATMTVAFCWLAVTLCCGWSCFRAGAVFICRYELGSIPYRTPSFKIFAQNCVSPCEYRVADR